ncbi:MAG: hypothetical protein RL095_4189 [Verrucomicrobiota bacterium]|jgi:hypothetical protein
MTFLAQLAAALSLAAQDAPPAARLPSVFKIEDYGAVADDDKPVGPSFQKAIEKLRCR